MTHDCTTERLQPQQVTSLSAYEVPQQPSPMSAFGPKQTWHAAPHMSAFGGKADMTLCGNPLSRSLFGVLSEVHYSRYGLAPRQFSSGIEEGLFKLEIEALREPFELSTILLHGRQSLCGVPKYALRPILSLQNAKSCRLEESLVPFGRDELGITARTAFADIFI